MTSPLSDDPNYPDDRLQMDSGGIFLAQAMLGNDLALNFGFHGTHFPFSLGFIHNS